MKMNIRTIVDRAEAARSQEATNDGNLSLIPTEKTALTISDACTAFSYRS